MHIIIYLPLVKPDPAAWRLCYSCHYSTQNGDKNSSGTNRCLDPFLNHDQHITMVNCTGICSVRSDLLPKSNK